MQKDIPNELGAVQKKAYTTATKQLKIIAYAFNNLIDEKTATLKELPGENDLIEISTLLRTLLERENRRLD